MRLKEVYKTIIFFILFFSFLIILRLFFFTPVIVKGDSMSPTLKDGERVIALKRLEIARFDIVTFIAPDDTEKNYIKRVIGLPGDIIEYHQDVLYVNGQAQEEAYLSEYKAAITDEDTLTDDFDMSLFGVEKIPEGKYLVLGDHRQISKDSRSIGLIDEEDLLGDVTFVFWPLDKFGFIAK